MNVHDQKPAPKGGSLPRLVRHDCEIVTITMQRRDWQMIADYFENNIEAMGEHDKSLQRRARKAQDWIRQRIRNGNARGSRTRGAMPNVKLTP